jgi:uncharacterized protein YtpQ (UPF0354 family)
MLIRALSGNNANLVAEKLATHEGTTRTYTVIDMEKTIQNIQDAKFKEEKALLEKIRDFALNYKNKAELSEKPASGGVTHWRDITAIQDVNSKLVGDPGTYCDVPA